MSTPPLVYYVDGIRVENHAPDDFPFAPLHALLAQPDEAIIETPTVFSLPLDTVQEEAPAGAVPTGANIEAGRQPSTIVP